MKTNKQSTKHTNPHVKWGALALAALCIAVEIALFALNLYANTGKLADASISLGFVAAYGWILGGILLIVAGCELFEEFIPSCIRFKNYKRYLLYKSSIYHLVSEPYKKETEAYEDLRKELGME